MPVAEFAGRCTPARSVLDRAVDPANHTAVASVDTDVTSTLVKAAIRDLAVPPSTLEAGIAVQGCHTVIDGCVQAADDQRVGRGDRPGLGELDVPGAATLARASS